MPIMISELSFASPMVRWLDRLPGRLIEQELCCVVDDDEELVEYLLGQDSLPEAVAAAASRDHVHGMASVFIEFVPTSRGEKDRAGFDVDRVAIGHGLGEPGFDEVAAVVLPARFAGLPDLGNPAKFIDGFSPLIIKRVACQVRIQGNGTLSVGAAPLYARCDESSMTATAEWLMQRLQSERLKTSVFH